MPDTFQYPQRELTNREQRLVDKQAAGKRLSARQQQEIADLDDRELKRFTDQELKDLSENELKEIIQSGEGQESDRRRYINAWIEKHYGANIRRITDATTPIISTIGLHGIDDNQVVEYVDKFLQSTQGNLSGDYVNIVGSLMNNNKIKASDDWLYEPWLYNETTKNNVYKLKALAFVSDRSNVKRYGLEDESGNPLTIDSLKGKAADQMLDTIEKAQTKNLNDEDTTFYDVAQDNKSGAQNEFDYFRDVLKKANPTNVDKLLQVLDYISKDNTAKRDFLYSDSSNNTIQKDLVRYLQHYSSRNSRALARNSNQGTGRNISGSYTVNDWLKEHNLAPIDIYAQFSKDLGTKVSRGKVSKYREYLTLILNNRTQLSNLLKYSVADDTHESMLNSIVSYLNSFHEIVKKQNRIKKAEADLKNKPEVKQLMDDVVDALVTNLQLTRADAITRFKQHYRPGMDEEQLLSEIVREL